MRIDVTNLLALLFALMLLVGLMPLTSTVVALTFILTILHLYVGP